MINNLLERRRYWDNPKHRAPREEHDLTDSMPYPFDSVIEELFEDQSVLEIGPGRGRQYDRLKDKVAYYSLCDISQQALDEPVFDDVLHRFLLSDYSNDFMERFDVVHFWYVLHHIRIDELSDFFGFVAKHLKVGGLALFNSPQTGNAREWYTNNGIGTTWMDHKTVVDAYTPHLVTVDVIKQDERSSGYLFVARKP